ncbi:hypothetical protein COO60DRAFT_1551537, partial [Scenedesmus sp. NREL 46B-D3]
MSPPLFSGACLLVLLSLCVSVCSPPALGEGRSVPYFAACMLELADISSRKQCTSAIVRLNSSVVRCSAIASVTQGVLLPCQHG